MLQRVFSFKGVLGMLQKMKNSYRDRQDLEYPLQTDTKNPRGNIGEELSGPLPCFLE